MIKKMQVISIFFAIFSTILILTANAQNSHYCQKAGVIELKDDRLTIDVYSRYPNETTYRDNTLCEWIIKAAPGHRIQLYDFSVDVQFVPDYSNCNKYDYLQIDELNEDGTTELNLATICRNEYYQHVLSINNQLSIKFVSDFVINAKGIKFSARIWDPKKDCPFRWYKTDDEECFGLFDGNTKLTLNRAQKHCNLARSNLGSFNRKEKLENFINEHMNKFETNLAWFSLNDIETKDTYKWIENEKLSYDAKIYSAPENSNENCFALELLELMRNKNQTQRPYQFTRLPCDSKMLKFNFICKMKQKESTQIYQMPQAKTLKDVHESTFNIFLRIGFPILAALIGICLILMICYSSRLEKSCSNSNLFAARLSTFIVSLVLTIAFITLFVMGILTRSRLALAVGIPVLVLIFLTILFLIYLKVRSSSDSSSENGKNYLSRTTKGNESELEELKGKDRKAPELPSYEQATHN